MLVLYIVLGFHSEILQRQSNFTEWVSGTSLFVYLVCMCTLSLLPGGSPNKERIKLYAADINQ